MKDCSSSCLFRILSHTSTSTKYGEYDKGIESALVRQTPDGLLSDATITNGLAISMLARIYKELSALFAGIIAVRSRVASDNVTSDEHASFHRGIVRDLLHCALSIL